MEKRNIALAGVIQGSQEIDAVNRVLTTEPFWHVSGKECTALQEELAQYHNVKYCVVVNSGSSANLLALQALNLNKGDRVLTSACGFPASLNPLIHLGLRPVLVDYDLDKLNISLMEIDEILGKIPDTKALLIAHTLGSTSDIEELMEIAELHNVKLIEDCCESMGTTFNGKCVGSFGEVSTISFYSSHQISGFGGGGAVLTNNEEIYEQVKSLRDWGKKSVREGQICTKMDTEVNGIPYDQQYTYDTIGYNMRFPDGNCAYAREQLKKLPKFIEIRQRNYLFLHQSLKDLPLRQMKWRRLT